MAPHRRNRRVQQPVDRPHSRQHPRLPRPEASSLWSCSTEAASPPTCPVRPPPDTRKRQLSQENSCFPKGSNCAEGVDNPGGLASSCHPMTEPTPRPTAASVLPIPVVDRRKLPLDSLPKLPPTPALTWTVGTGPVGGLAIDEERGLLAAGNDKGDVQLFDLVTGADRGRFWTDGFVWALAFSPDHRYLDRRRQQRVDVVLGARTPSTPGRRRDPRDPGPERPPLPQPRWEPAGRDEGGRIGRVGRPGPAPALPDLPRGFDGGERGLRPVGPSHLLRRRAHLAEPDPTCRHDPSGEHRAADHAPREAAVVSPAR